MSDIKNVNNGDNFDAKPCLSVDLEDYYHGNYPGYDYMSMKFEDSRVVEPTQTMLDVLDATGCRVTFFVLDEIARKFPDLVRTISGRGHEIACHGDNHVLLTKRRREDVLEGLTRSVEFLEDLTGQKVLGYRAPNFSASFKKTPWLFEKLIGLGIRYDSSRFPAKSFYSGEPFMDKFPHAMFTCHDGTLYEVPISTSGLSPFRLVWSGGFYWRILPLNLIKKRIRRRLSSGKAAVLYLHPKDIDPNNPPLPIGRIDNWVHRVGTAGGLGKLVEMCKSFDFVPIKDILPIRCRFEKETIYEFENREATEAI
jgi:polysaccharide deacetylase family protein (PEP-CTERM system associated)